MGFTRGFKPVGPRHLQRPQAMRRACFLFVKINAEHFDRDMFTTTAAPSTTSSTTPHNRGHRNREAIMKSSITQDLEEEDASQEQPRKRRKRPLNENGEEEEENSEKRRRGDHRRQHNQRLAAASPQPKNLERRRRKFQREEHARKMRLQNQRRRKQIESHQNLPPPPGPPPPFASSSSSSSASASVSATSLAATASLAPSALNIVAMLAAGRRKKSRRKKQSEGGTSQTQTAHGQEGHEAVMDLQLVVQQPAPAADNLYDSASARAKESKSGSSIHGNAHHHEHNYYQQQQQHRQFQPVTSSVPATPENNVQPQNHKYSNSPKDTRNLSNSHKQHSRRSSPNHSHKRSHSSRNYKHSHSDSYSDSHSNLNEENNTNVNVNNAIPALPKNFNVSKDERNHNNQYFTTQMTDFKTNKRMLPKHSQSLMPQPQPLQQLQHQPQHLPLHKRNLKEPPPPPTPHQPSHHHTKPHQSHFATGAADTLKRSRRDLSLIHSLTSQHQRRELSTSLPRPEIIKMPEITPDTDKQAELITLHTKAENGNTTGVSVAIDNNNNEGNAIVGNSNRLLGNSNHMKKDNNFQHQQEQQQHLVNRLKLIYLNRISNDSNTNTRSNSNNTKTNKEYILNNTKNHNKEASIPSHSSSKSSNSINDNSRPDEVATLQRRSQLLKLNLKQNVMVTDVADKDKDKQNEDTTNVNTIISYNNPKVISNDLNDNAIEKETADKEKIKSLYAALCKLFFLGRHVNRQQQHDQPEQQQQQLQVIDNTKLINNNNNNNKNYVQYTNYKHDDVNHHHGNVNDDDDENANDDELIRNENKYEKIIVQYRSVVYLLQKEMRENGRKLSMKSK